MRHVNVEVLEEAVVIHHFRNNKTLLINDIHMALMRICDWKWVNRAPYGMLTIE